MIVYSWRERARFIVVQSFDSLSMTICMFSETITKVIKMRL